MAGVRGVLLRLRVELSEGSGGVVQCNVLYVESALT